MIRSYKGRTVSAGERVDVYRNVNKDEWSIRAVSGPHKGLVVGHADELFLHDVQFRISETQQARARREKRKNVHAVARGMLESRFHVTANAKAMTQSLVWYNPFKVDRFQNLGQDIDRCRFLRFDDEGRTYTV